ncbi:MAG: hypothetical protein FWC43_02070, partial [Planctomycetaceae bacterium]|nr:hypothetical protein [Planctomycetaceae bacterium]
MQTFKIEQTDLQCVVTWRFFSFAVVFSLVFLTIWTVGCLVMTGAALAHQQFEVLLFMLPFWAVWLVLLAFIANVLFGKT